MWQNNEETRLALNTLTKLVEEQSKPLVLWIGAGVSSWAGFPFWDDLANKLHGIFLKEEPNYCQESSTQFLEQKKYPLLFEQIRLANECRYFSFLAEQFKPKPFDSVYERFIKTIKKIPNISIVTTNVDEALEHNLTNFITIQRSDIERISSLLYKKQPFICKLHGSTSSVESMVFSARDYQFIEKSSIYIDSVKALFSDSTVIFLGYGLRDQYVLETIKQSLNGRPLFGIGPHFIVTPEERNELPSLVRRIGYKPDVVDHRDVIGVLDLISLSEITQYSKPRDTQENKVSTQETIYYLADLWPQGTWTTSNILHAHSKSGEYRKIIVGEGFRDDEIIVNNYSALHDIVVGLICFDVVYVPIGRLGHVHELLGSEMFWIIVNSGSLRIIVPPSESGVIFDNDYSLIGYLGDMDHCRENDKDEFLHISLRDRIRKHLRPVNGKEDEADILFDNLAKSTIDLSIDEHIYSVANKTRSALLNPLIRNLLGVSLATPSSTIPRWLAFPVLRFAKVISTGIICQQIGASSTRMIFGSEKLVSVAFSIDEDYEWADTAASYVLTGRFDSDVGEIIRKEPDLLFEILRFRDSPAGESFRIEVGQRLSIDEGGQIVTAINSGLKQALPANVLQTAHDQLSGLFIPRNKQPGINPAVLGDLRNSDSRIAKWRQRSKSMLQEEMKNRGLGIYSFCPCGSGEKIKFCCLKALSS